MSDMFTVATQLVKGCQTLVMDPSSPLQQSLLNTVPHTIMVHWHLLGSGQEFQDLTKIWPNFLTTHHWCLACPQCVCSLWRVVRAWSWTQPAYRNNHWWIQCLKPSWCTDRYSGQGENVRIWPKSGLTFWPHIIDVWHVPSGYVACEGLSDLGNGPNQPTATIIGEYSTSYHHGALILALVMARMSGSDQNLA